ncbi:MAG TPA: 50S ribosomal protein L11 methyltransferase [Solirubrobacteraceae bacterium]|jgi:ribosomal protein L11 methyltransferase|nr:50S ribosomal protein L11 methyltransferase [Solirubrobacteraceae bacterium]
MREVIVRFPAHALDDVLDRILPIVPDGVREAPAPRGQVELRMAGPHLPPLRDIARAVRPTPFQISERAVPDDWRERRLADYEAHPIGGRLVVRPPWAPSPPDGMLDIVLEEGGAFGAGTHPTTRKCLELMLGMTGEGSFADLGCGSGVLAILAGLLGFSPLTAVDVQPGSVEATGVNAARAGLDVQAGVADLSREPAPPARSFVANVPPAVHAGIAASWREESEPQMGLLSGFSPAHADAVASAYAESGFTERQRHEDQGWVVSEMSRAP